MSTTEQEDEYSAAFDDIANGTTEAEAEEPEAELNKETEQESDDADTGKESNDSKQENEPETEGQDEPGEVDELENLKRERDYYKHGFDANRGRVSAYQKKINELEAQAKAPENNGDPKGKSESDPADNPDGSGMTDDQWKEFADEYPELASALDTKLAKLDQAMNARMGEIEHQVTPLKEKAHEDYVSNQIAALETKHPDWQKVTSSDEFSKWITEQPEAVRNLSNSMDAQDASFLIESFKSMGNAQSSDSSQQRQDRLRQSVNFKSKGGGRQTGIPDDYDKAFDYFASQSK